MLMKAFPEKSTNVYEPANIYIEYKAPAFPTNSQGMDI